MALFAFDGRMRTLKFVFRQIMVEFLFVKPDHIKFSSVMFAMAGEAIFALCF